MKIKVCGMKYAENIQAVVNLEPDYLGFIFYNRSPRFALNYLDESQLLNLPSTVEKVGVFVNEETHKIKNIATKYGIKVLQLHGNESPECCSELMALGITVIKAFGIDEYFDFAELDAYQNSCNLNLWLERCKELDHLCIISCCVVISLCRTTLHFRYI